METNKFHFMATSVAEWKVNTDLRQLIRSMQRSKFFPYKIFYIPLDIEAHYKIEYYTPQVEGRICLGKFDK
jgi:hypothetical protein